MQFHLDKVKQTSLKDVIGDMIMAFIELSVKMF